MSPFSWHSQVLLFVLAFLSWTLPGIDACHVRKLGLASNQCYLNTRYHLPTVVVIATGGTISGEGDSPTDTTHYRAGAVDIDDILREIRPYYENDVHVISHQLLELDSINFNLSHTITLAHTIKQYSYQPHICGVVVSSGTSLAVDEATLLEHLLDIGIPVVVTGAFKPYTALGADGLSNLLASIFTAAICKLNRVFLLSNDQLLLPYGTRKENNRFVPGPGSHVGDIINFRPVIRYGPRYVPKKLDISRLSPEQTFPVVEGFSAYMGFRAETFERSIPEVDGIVLESFDHGYWPDISREVLERSIKNEGLFVVVVPRDTSFRVDHDRIRGAAAVNQWSLGSAINLLSVILALQLGREETMDFISNPWLST
jgi:L-asparaginase